MLTSVQILLICLIGVFALLSIIFTIMFIVQMSAKQEEETEENEEPVESVFIVKQLPNSGDEKVSVSDMLEKLDRLTNSDEEKSEKEQSEEVKSEAEGTEIVDSKVIGAENVSTEKAETSKAVEEPVEEVKVEVVEKPVEEVKVKVVEKPVEETKVETAEEDSAELETSVVETNIDDYELVPGASLIDYQNRLEKIIQTRDKISRDLEKVKKSILKYERTKRRKDRNQRMLDRRAGELTNLNLVMYSVTDIKNVDEEKKIKQEELTAHIAELKASIQDADEYIESNKEKNVHDVKMAKYLQGEMARYNDEIAEIEKLIKATENDEN